MQHKRSRRNFLKNAITTLFSFMGVLLGSGFYVRYIEPFWLSITNHTITHKLIPPSFDGIKILQFSDTHIGFQYQIQDLEKTVQTINHLQPDIVVFTGDLLDRPDEFYDQNEIISTLSKIMAPLGKYSVYGNHDHGGYGTENYAMMMKESGFELLRNGNRIINYRNEQIMIAGIDDPVLGTPKWKQTLFDLTNQQFCLLLSHAPDLADQAKHYNVALQLSGHSHGGQVKIPLVGSFMMPIFAKKYYEGMYDLSPLLLYVNRGLGTTRMPIRLLARPEISIFTLKTK